MRGETALSLPSDTRLDQGELMRTLIGTIVLALIIGGGSYAAYKFCPPVQEFVAGTK